MPETILSDKETAGNKEGPAFLLACVRVNLMKYRITGAQICFEQQDYLASASLEPWFQTDYLALPLQFFLLCPISSAASEFLCASVQGAHYFASHPSAQNLFCLAHSG